MRRLIATGIVVLALAGCTSGTTTSEASGSPSATTEEPAPPDDRSVMSTETAATYYLSSMCPVNGALSSFNEAVAGSPGVPTPVDVLRVSASSMAVAYREAASRLAQPPNPWPLDVRKGVARLEQEAAATSQRYLRMVSAPSSSLRVMVRADIPVVDHSPTARRVRAGLGLPVNDVDDSGCNRWPEPSPSI